MVETLENGTYWVRRFEVASHSNPDKSYVVAMNTKDEWGCSCPVWKFGRKQCKHINEVLQVTRNQDIVDQTHERAANVLVERHKLSNRVIETPVPSRFAFVEV